METPQEFLSRTESAVQHLFNDIDAYIQILRDAPSPVLVGSYPSEEDHQAALHKWIDENQEQIQQSLAAERQFLSQKYALAILCGSVLQIAWMAIRLYSRNNNVPADFADVINPGTAAAPYCIGRRVRSVPIGLVIYAGRNQYNHADDEHLREPSPTIFERLATNHAYGEGVRDPAFDLSQRFVWNYSSNITSILGWRTYDAYHDDMRILLGISDTM